MRFALRCALLVSAGCSPADRATRFSLAGESPPRAEAFNATENVALTELFTLHGKGEGPDSTFGFVSAVVFGADSSIYVADTRRAEIVAFTPDGHFVRTYGARGAGRGELLNPAALAVQGNRLFVYDKNLGKVVGYDSTAATVVEFDLSLHPPISILSPAPQTLIIAGADSGYATVARYDLEGREQTRYLTSGATTHVLPSMRMCHYGNEQLVIANAAFYELAAISLATKQIDWIHRWHSTVLGLRESSDADTIPMAKAYSLGLACDGDRMIFGYLDQTGYQLYYDVIARSGTPIGRLHFDRAEHQLFPGFPADLIGNRLATFRSRPVSRVVIYRLTAGADTMSALQEGS